MRIPLLKGRYFTEQDTKECLPVALIDETRRSLLPDEEPLGKRVEFRLSRANLSGARSSVWRVA
jgi:hypothetical protein